MNIYIEFKKSKLRVMIGTEQIEVAIPSNFYSPVPGTESFYMFREDETNNQLKDLVERHRSHLGFLGKIRYWFFRNSVFSLVDKEVQDLTTLVQIVSYTGLFLNARVDWVIKKPEAFDSTNLNDVEKVRQTYINRGRVKGDVVLSKMNSYDDR